MTEDELMGVRADLGMVFQEGALFDSLTVRENVGYKLFEELNWKPEEANQRVEEVLGFIGLAEFIDRKPSELSGGQRRRVAIARAMAAKPRILLYDEPTTGLDPITSITVDEEIIKLRDLEGVSSIVVTHQLRDAFFVAEHTRDRAGGERHRRSRRRPPAKCDEAEFIMLKDGRIAFEGNAGELRAAAAKDPVHRGVSFVRIDRYATHTIACLVRAQNRHHCRRRPRPRGDVHHRRRRPGGFSWQRYEPDHEVSPTSRA